MRHRSAESSPLPRERQRPVRLPGPTRSEKVLRAMRRMHRQQGRRQQQAFGLSCDLLQLLLAVTGELVHLRIDDLTAGPDGTGSILLRFSKTDQAGEGKTLPLPRDTMAACRAWQGTGATRRATA